MFNFRVKTTSLHNLETFIDKIEHTIFQPSNPNKNIFRNVKKPRKRCFKQN